MISDEDEESNWVEGEAQEEGGMADLERQKRLERLSSLSSSSLLPTITIVSGCVAQ